MVVQTAPERGPTAESRSFDICLDIVYKRIGSRPLRDDYRRALKGAMEEYERLRGKRDELDTCLAQLEQTIGTLAALLKRESLPQAGFTDAIRTVLRASVEALTPRQVRDQLVASGFPLSEYSNPLASIHTVLKRLVRAREAHSFEGPPGTTQYWWNRPMSAIGSPRVRR